MPEKDTKHTQPRPLKMRLPDSLNEYALHISYLQAEGWFPAIEKAMRMDGWTGHNPFDIFLFACGAILTDKEKGGLDGYYHRIKAIGPSAAALAGRRTIPSDASAGRYLQAVDAEAADLAGRSLTLESAARGIAALGSRAAVKDTESQFYHFFDLDGTADVFNQRLLVRSEEYPGHGELPSCLAAPGHSGRKRGNLVMSRSLLVHGGSSHWLGAWVTPGNLNPLEAAREAVRYLALFAESAGVERRRIVLRMDGAFGHGGVLAAVSEAEMMYLTRLQRYELFTHQSLRRRLNEGPWHELPLTEEGVRRYVTDAGGIVMPTNSPDLPGAPPEITARLIVTRRRHGGGKPRAGRVIGDWVYEMFAANLPAGAWPAAEIVMQYQERGGGENNIKMLRKETPFRRLYSENPEGLRLMNCLGMFIWNNRLNMALALDKEPPAELPAEPRAIKEAADLPPPFPEDQLPAREAAPSPCLAEILSQLDTGGALARHPGASWDALRGCFVCPARQVLRFHLIKQQGKRHYASFRTQWRVCAKCPSKPECTSSKAAKFAKEIALPISGEPLELLRKALAAPGREAGSRSRHSPEIPAAPGPFRLLPSLEFPRERRRKIENLLRQFSVHVVIEPDGAPRSAYTADSVYQQRRRRRRTWEWRFMKNHLPGKAVLTFQAKEEAGLRTLIPRGRPAGRMPYGQPVNAHFRLVLQG